jgi:Cdc6-like AAA superfamily ATPase
MNNWALKTLPVRTFQEDVLTQASQLSTSKSVQDVCDSICKNLVSNCELVHLFNISGLTGSGRTTFCKAVLKNLIRNDVVKESEVLFLKIDKNDTPNCVWNCAIQLARAKNLGGITAVLATQDSTQEEKENAIVSVFDSYKVVCFDNLSISEWNQQLYTLLVSIIHKVKTNVICVTKPNSLFQQYGTPVEVYGLNLAVITGDLNWQKSIQFMGTSYKSTSETVRLNPKAVQMLANARQVLGEVCSYEAVGDENPVVDVLNLIWDNLSEHEKVVLLQLSELRRALPLKDAAGMMSRVIQIGLVEYEPPETHGSLFAEVILSDCIREFVLRKKDDNTIVETSFTFDVLQYWMTLLSDELVGLIEDAKSNSWPFIPEKW